MAGDVFHGLEPVAAATSDFNAFDFIAKAAVARVATATLVQVVAVDTDARTVDVHPMVAQLDGIGNATPHGVIHNVPYARQQGGPHAIVIDPMINDIGVAVFASRDISAVKATKAPANPGSRRRFSMADAIYLGGVLNAEPEIYVKVSAAGIELHADVTRATGSLSTDDNLSAGTGATGSFTTVTGQVVTVEDGIITNIF